MACCVCMKCGSGSNGGTRRRAELRSDDGSDVSVSAEREDITASLCSACIHSAVPRLLLTAMTDAEDGDAGGDMGGLMMMVIMVIMGVRPFLVLLVPCSQTQFRTRHTSPPPCRGPYRCTTTTAGVTLSVLIMSTSLHMRALVDFTFKNSKLGPSISLVLTVGPLWCFPISFWVWFFKPPPYISSLCFLSGSGGSSIWGHRLVWIPPLKKNNY